MKQRKVGDVRYLRHPKTKKRIAASKIVGIIDGGSVSGDWGLYEFEAWLERDIGHPTMYYISFPYYRNGRFAAQYTFRAPPSVVRTLVDGMMRRGWLSKRGWMVKPPA